jgi:hypothetical protein
MCRSDLVRGQDPVQITVAIRNTSDTETVGTGIVVSADCKIVTCAHVVLAAGLSPRTGRPPPPFWKDLASRLLSGYTTSSPGDLYVVFPRSRTVHRRARVLGQLPDSDDDVAILQVVEEDRPRLSAEQVAILGGAAESTKHAFSSYGYTRLGQYPAIFADGEIVGQVLGPEGRTLRLNPVQLKSQQIDQGMSGAPVLDTIRNLVVGIVSETYHAAGAKNRDTAWAVDASVLALSPFRLPLESAPLARKAGVEPSVPAASLATAATPLTPLALNNAPAAPPAWIGRTDLLAALTKAWTQQYKRVVGLTGFGGDGKSVLVRKWIEELLMEDTSTLPRGIFWWTFSDKASVEEFFEAALTFMAPDLPTNRVESSADSARLIGSLLARGRFLLVLDGLEALQYPTTAQFGLVTSGDLKQLLTYFASGYHHSMCVVTSRLPLVDLLAYASYSDLTVGRLAPEEGIALLESLGVHGLPKTLWRIVSEWEGHALSLSLIASFLSEHHHGIAEDLSVTGLGGDHFTRLQDLLVRYDGQLTSQQRTVLAILSACRRGASRQLVQAVARDPWPSQPPFVSCAPQEVVDALDQLVKKRLVLDIGGGLYTCHQLVRRFYAIQASD